jgi:hypothetical protein
VRATTNTQPAPPKALVLELINPGAGASLGSPSAMTVTLVDDDRSDLVVAALSVPVQAATGVPMKVIATVRNVAGGVAPATTLGIFVSSSSSVPGAGTQIGTLSIPALGGGATFAASGAITVPPALAPGSYFLSAVADTAGVIVGENTINNGLTASTQIEVVAF